MDHELNGAGVPGKCTCSTHYCPIINVTRSLLFSAINFQLLVHPWNGFVLTSQIAPRYSLRTQHLHLFPLFSAFRKVQVWVQLNSSHSLQPLRTFSPITMSCATYLLMTHKVIGPAASGGQTVLANNRTAGGFGWSLRVTTTTTTTTTQGYVERVNRYFRKTFVVK